MSLGIQVKEVSIYLHTSNKGDWITIQATMTKLKP